MKYRKPKNQNCPKCGNPNTSWDYKDKQTRWCRNCKFIYLDETGEGLNLTKQRYNDTKL